MPRPEFAAEVFAYPRNLREGQLRERVHFLRRWIENDVRTLLPANFQVLFQCSRIYRIVLVWTELKRIDKNADDDHAAFPARRSNQRCMTRMDRSHGWNKADEATGNSRWGKRGKWGRWGKRFSNVLKGLDYIHGGQYQLRFRASLEAALPRSRSARLCASPASLADRRTSSMYAR